MGGKFRLITDGHEECIHIVKQPCYATKAPGNGFFTRHGKEHALEVTFVKRNVFEMHLEGSKRENFTLLKVIRSNRFIIGALLTTPGSKFRAWFDVKKPSKHEMSVMDMKVQKTILTEDGQDLVEMSDQSLSREIRKLPSAVKAKLHICSEKQKAKELSSMQRQGTFLM